MELVTIGDYTLVAIPFKDRMSVTVIYDLIGEEELTHDISTTAYTRIKETTKSKPLENILKAINEVTIFDDPKNSLALGPTESCEACFNGGWACSINHLLSNEKPQTSSTSIGVPCDLCTDHKCSFIRDLKGLSSSEKEEIFERWSRNSDKVKERRTLWFRTGDSPYAAIQSVAPATIGQTSDYDTTTPTTGDNATSMKSTESPKPPESPKTTTPDDTTPDNIVIISSHTEAELANDAELPYYETSNLTDTDYCHSLKGIPAVPRLVSQVEGICPRVAVNSRDSKGEPWLARVVELCPDVLATLREYFEKTDDKYIYQSKKHCMNCRSQGKLHCLFAHTPAPNAISTTRGFLALGTCLCCRYSGLECVFVDGYGRNADAWAVPPTAPFLHGPLAGLSVYPMERAYIKSPLVDVVPVESVLLSLLRNVSKPTNTSDEELWKLDYRLLSSYAGILSQHGSPLACPDRSIKTGIIFQITSHNPLASLIYVTNREANKQLLSTNLAYSGELATLLALRAQSFEPLALPDYESIVHISAVILDFDEHTRLAMTKAIDHRGPTHSAVAGLSVRSGPGANEFGAWFLDPSKCPPRVTTFGLEGDIKMFDIIISLYGLSHLSGWEICHVAYQDDDLAASGPRAVEFIYKSRHVPLQYLDPLRVAENVLNKAHLVLRYHHLAIWNAARAREDTIMNKLKGLDEAKLKEVESWIIAHSFS